MTKTKKTTLAIILLIFMCISAVFAGGGYLFLGNNSIGVDGESLDVDSGISYRHLSDMVSGEILPREDETYHVSFAKPANNFRQVDPVDAKLHELMPKPGGTAQEQAGQKLLGYYSKPNGEGVLYYATTGPIGDIWVSSNLVSILSVNNYENPELDTLYPFYSPKAYSTLLDPNFGEHIYDTVENNYMGYNYYANRQHFDLAGHKAPHRDGYKFTGYYESLDYDKLDKDGNPTVAGEKYIDEKMMEVYSSGFSGFDDIPRSIHAGWEEDNTEYYTVTFDDNGGKDGPGSIKLDTEGDMSMPGGLVSPTRKGYGFEGYYDSIDADGNATGTQYYDKDMKSLKSWDKGTDGTLYSKWSGWGYKMFLDHNDGSDVVEEYPGGDSKNWLYFGDPLPSDRDAPTRDGYDFLGYYENADFNNSGNQYYNEKMEGQRLWDRDQDDNTLYAKWLKEGTEPPAPPVETYTVTLNNNGGTGGTASVEVKDGENMPSGKSAPSRGGYTFEGYYDTKNDTGGKKYYNTNMSSASTWDKGTDGELWARWQENDPTQPPPPVETYTITLDKNGGTGGSGSTKVDASDGAFENNITAPTKANFIFLGYYDTKDGNIDDATQYLAPPTTGEFLTIKKNWDKTSDGTLYARWKEDDTDPDGGNGGDKDGDKDSNKGDNNDGGKWLLIGIIAGGVILLAVGAFIFIKIKKGGGGSGRGGRGGRKPVRRGGMKF